MVQLPLPLNSRLSRLAIIALDVVFAASLFTLTAVFTLGALAFARDAYTLIF